MNGYLFWANIKVQEWEWLLDKDFWNKFLDKLLKKLEFTRPKDLLPGKNENDRFFVAFPGGGWTIFQAIAESAITIHTYHEEQKFRLEISSCKWFDRLKVVELLDGTFDILFLNYGFLDWRYGRVIV